MTFLFISLLSIVSGIMNFNSEAGLRNGYINDIAQDKNGYLWIATNSGLCRFDGEKFLYMDDTTPMVTKLLYDPENDILYSGTGNGLISICCQTMTLQREFDIKATISSLTFSKDSILAGSRYGSLYAIDRKSQNITEYEEGCFGDFPDSYLAICNYEHYLAVGHVAEGFSLIDLNTKEVQRFTNNPEDPSSLPGNKVYCLYKDSVNNLWIGTNKGLAIFNPARNNFTVFRYDPTDPSSIISDHIMAITEMNNHRLWISSDIGGVSILDINQLRYGNTEKIKFINIESTKNEFGLSSKNIRSIHEDSFGNVWIAQYGEGLDCIPKNDNHFHSITYTGSEFTDTNKPVCGLAFDSDGKLWMGTDNEVVVLDGEKIIKQYSLTPYISRSNTKVYSILHDDDYVFLGLYDHGLLRLDRKNDTMTSIDIGSDVDVNNLWKDSDGSIWVGTKTGAVHLSASPENKILEIPSTMYGISSYGFSRDSNGRLWIGGYGVGLCLMNEDYSDKRVYGRSVGIGPIIHQTYQTDDSKELWVATKDGLFHISDMSYPEEYEYFGLNHGMNNSYVRALCQDNDGNIWFSTDTGISLLDLTTGTIRNFGIEHGTVRGNYIDGTWAVSPTDGSIWFGSLGGLCYFFPDRVIADNIISDVCIHEYNGKPFNGQRIELKHKNRLDIRFGVQNFASKNNIEYAYRLSRHNDAWIETGTVHEVTFLKLPWGRNTFQVKARSTGNGWTDDNISSMVIHVKPPVFFRWYFIVLYLTICILIISIITRSSNRRFKDKVALETEREKLAFYTSITHELRTPLTLITGPLEDLAESDEMPEHIHAKVGLIRKSADRLLEMVNMLLEIRKVEFTGKKINMHPVNISSLVNEIGVHFKDMNTNKNVSYIIDVPPSERIINADRGIIRTILENLLSNAIKNTDSGTICLCLEWLPDNHNPEKVCISVKDTGLGIPDEEIDKIFDYMYQVNNGQNDQGSGLGLSLVRSLAELHGAEINVDSKLGVGSIFSISINVKDTGVSLIDNESVNIPDAPEELSGKERKIMLVIEDNDDIREYITQSFKNEFSVITAHNGEEGLQKAMDYTPDIIITDIMMPGMDGYELISAIKDNIRISHTPIIVLTAKDRTYDRQTAYDLGVDSFIAKPFSTTLLRSRINNILQRRAAMMKQMVDLSLENGFKYKNVENKCLTQIDREFLNRFSDIVENNLSDSKLNLSVMQEHFHMSHSTLYRKIKSLTGLSVNEYIRKIRLHHALRMLQEEGLNVSETAYSCGFNDLSYFTSCFKKEFGATPSEKRKTP